MGVMPRPAIPLVLIDTQDHVYCSAIHPLSGALSQPARRFTQEEKDMATELTPTRGGGQTSLSAKAGELLKEKGNQVSGFVCRTGPKTATIYTARDLLLFRYCRRGKDRYPEWHLEARHSRSRGLRFRSKRAALNYERVGLDCHPCDEPLVDLAFRQHVTNTRSFRRARKEMDLRHHGSGQCSLAVWMSDYRDFDGEQCLFLPNAVCFSPTRVLFNFQRMSAARAMLVAIGGPEGPGAVVRHKCGMGHMSCVNPKHLAWGSVLDNARDRSLHGAKIFGPDDCPVDLYPTICKDQRLVNVIAWDFKIPAALVAAVKASTI